MSEGLIEMKKSCEGCKMYGVPCYVRQEGFSFGLLDCPCLDCLVKSICDQFYSECDERRRLVYKIAMYEVEKVEKKK